MTNHAFSRRAAILVAMMSSAAALICMGCSSPSGPSSGKDVTVEVDSGGFPYSGSVQILNGSTLTVKLYSNPTTGYQWLDPVTISDPTVLAQTGHEYAPPSSGNAGAAGQDVWKFKAIGKGRFTIYTEHKRAWETIPDWTFTLAGNVI